MIHLIATLLRMMACGDKRQGTMEAILVSRLLPAQETKDNRVPAQPNTTVHTQIKRITCTYRVEMNKFLVLNTIQINFKSGLLLIVLKRGFILYALYMHVHSLVVS